jgi:hypothetical protein
MFTLSPRKGFQTLLNKLNWIWLRIDVYIVKSSLGFMRKISGNEKFALFNVIGMKMDGSSLE